MTSAVVGQPGFPPWEGRVTEEAAMAATSTLVRYEDPLDVRERGTVAGFLAGYSGNTRVSTRPICACSPAGAPTTGSACWRCDALIWRCSLGPWRKKAECAPPWLAACRRCAASTATATSKES